MKPKSDQSTKHLLIKQIEISFVGFAWTHLMQDMID